MIRVLKIIFVFLIFSILFLSAEEKQAEEEEIKTLKEERTDILQFGIDSEVISLIETLIEEKNDQFTEIVLEQAQKAVNQELISASFRLFSVLEYKDAESFAIKILENYDLYRNPIINASMNYLTKNMSDKAAEAIVPLMENDQAAVARNAIQAIGQSGKIKYAEKLIELLEDDDFHQDVKTTILVSLGDLKAESAIDILTDILQDTQEEKAWRWYACQALGKIANPESFSAIQAILGDPDPNLRGFAVEAIGYYDTKEAEAILIDALRDSFWKVRVSAAKQLGERGSESAIPSLIYKAKNDPENNVKKEAITAIGKIDTAEGIELLLDLAGKKTTNPVIWSHTVSLLIENNLEASFPILEKMLADEWAEEKSYYFDYIAKLLSVQKGAFLEDIMGRFMEHSSMVIKIYGIRGAEKNNFSRFKEKITEFSKEGNPRPIRQAAISALENM